jgi:hypothetical protein
MSGGGVDPEDIHLNHFYLFKWLLTTYRIESHPAR